MMDTRTELSGRHEGVGACHRGCPTAAIDKLTQRVGDNSIQGGGGGGYSGATQQLSCLFVSIDIAPPCLLY
uniref:Uncharacterized protein n=1 Tax=Physcomitrium patens TaxID=3218 RepID=A0A2K1ITV7_PHYPA|nr:hypothetical protein PHYPA_024648 [Physcomitrium patens]